MVDKIITESILTDERLHRVSDSAECLFFHFIAASDWRGRLPADPAIIGQRCFPLKGYYEQFLQALLDELEANGLIARCIHKHREHYILSAPELYRFHVSHTKRMSPSLWQAARNRVFRRDSHTCQYCGATEEQMHCDHVVPLSRGGTDEDENLATACERCNVTKGTKTATEFQAWLEGQRKQGG